MTCAAEHKVVQTRRAALGEMDDVMSFTPGWRAVTAWVAAMAVPHDKCRP